MGQGNYDHPSYLARQQVNLGRTTAGANGTSGARAFTNNERLRNVTAVIGTAGTSATTGNLLIVGCVGTCTQFSAAGVGTVGTATTTLGSITLGTSTALSVATSGDLNVCLNAGAVLYLKNGTDATGVVEVTGEMHVDPLGTWVGNG